MLRLETSRTSLRMMSSGRAYARVQMSSAVVAEAVAERPDAARLPLSPTAALALIERHGKPMFEYLPAHPDQAARFQGAITMFSEAEAAAVPAAYDFSEIGTLVDVGGSQDVLLASILSANSSVRGVLFDLPVMVQGAAELFAAHGVAARTTTVGGDFFQSPPRGIAIARRQPPQLSK